MCSQADHPPYPTIDPPESVVRFHRVRTETARQILEAQSWRELRQRRSFLAGLRRLARGWS